MTSAAVCENSSEHALLSDVFHELSQPLTALHCILELCLERDTSPQELRASVEKALENADRLRQRLVLMRAIYYLDEPSFAGHTADLHEVLREIHESMLPLFASVGQNLRLEFAPQAALVKSDSRQLSGALFYLLEYLLRHSSAGSATAIDVNVTADHFAEVQIESRASLPIAPASSEQNGPHSFELELARRTFCAAGGDFSIVQHDAAGCICRGRLPLA